MPADAPNVQLTPERVTELRAFLNDPQPDWVSVAVPLCDWLVANPDVSAPELSEFFRRHVKATACIGCHKYGGGGSLTHVWFDPHGRTPMLDRKNPAGYGPRLEDFGCKRARKSKRSVPVSPLLTHLAATRPRPRRRTNPSARQTDLFPEARTHSSYQDQTAVCAWCACKGCGTV